MKFKVSDRVKFKVGDRVKFVGDPLAAYLGIFKADRECSNYKISLGDKGEITGTKLYSDELRYVVRFDKQKPDQEWDPEIKESDLNYLELSPEVPFDSAEILDLNSKISRLCKRKSELENLKLTITNAANGYMKEYTHLENVFRSEIRNIDQDIDSLNKEIGSLINSSNLKDLSVSE